MLTLVIRAILHGLTDVHTLIVELLTNDNNNLYLATNHYDKAKKLAYSKIIPHTLGEFNRHLVFVILHYIMYFN